MGLGNRRGVARMGGRRSEIGLLSGREFSFEPDLSDTALIGPKFEFEGKWGSVGI